ncbi:MAG: CbiX/SirB N-terminal domain-containing protein [Pseudomonadota bacterium]
MAPAIDRPVLLVSHGWPSHPMQQEEAVGKLAARLQTLLPDTSVSGATLAAEGALDDAVRGLENPIICPWFMSDGWFVKTHLPKRLRAAGLKRWDTTAPLGMMPGISKLMSDQLKAYLAISGWQTAETTLILAAHGSPSSAQPRLATEAAALAIASHLRLKAIRPCYVDEAPTIRDGARGPAQAIVLPFFAARAGHVIEDLPEELEEAGFTGPVLDPVGLWPETPALAIAAIEAVLQAQYI